MAPRKSRLSKIFRKSYFVYVTILLFIFVEVYFLIPSIKNNLWQTSSGLPFASVGPQTQENSLKPSKEQKMNGVHLVENDGDFKGWELYSEEASGSKDELWVLKKVRIKFYKNDKLNFSVSGDIGEIDGQTKNMIIRGGVVTESANGYKFETSELKYEAKTKELYNDDIVKMTGKADKNGGALKLTGNGLHIYTQKNSIRISHMVETNKIIQNKKFNLKSETADFSNTDREAIFSGKVEIVYDDMQLKSPFAQFKYLKSKDILSTITAYDQVFFSQGIKVGGCSELIVDLIADTMTLNGKPHVKIDKDEIQGEQIVFSDKGKKVKINQLKMSRKN